MPEVSKFKQDNTLEDRKNETIKIMKKYDTSKSNISLD